jgi:DNA-binding XRE family transcriptional regulator
VTLECGAASHVILSDLPFTNRIGAMKKAALSNNDNKKYLRVGIFLREGRIRAGLTQREVSDALGYSDQQLVSNIERGLGLPSLRKLKLLVDLLALNPETLLERMFDDQRAIMLPVLTEKQNKR